MGRWLRRGPVMQSSDPRGPLPVVQVAAPSVDAPGLRAMREAAIRHAIDLVALVADVALWVDPVAHSRHVGPSNTTGAVRPDVRRARPGSGERAGAVVEGIRLDRNNYAGQAIRAAIGLARPELAGYQACHVWPDSCYDPRYHTVLANLVLVPAPLVSLTDHDPDVIAALKYRSFELYGWHPDESPAPVKPDRYPRSWPVPVPGRVRGGVSGVRPVVERTGPATAYTARPGTQREVMKRLWREHSGDRDAVVIAWVAAIGAGEVTRASNERGMDETEYAKRLINNGFRKGKEWLP